MAKRFTDSNKLKKKWLRCLEAPYKLLWIYILDDCDYAGIWEVDFEIANIYIGGGVEAEKALSFFGNRIHVFDNGDKWLVVDFIEFQYRKLNSNNPAHNNVIRQLNKYGLINESLELTIKQSPLKAPSEGAKEKEEVKVKEEETEKEIEKAPAPVIICQEFEDVRKIYPGTKRGYETEFNNFKNKHKDWERILEILKGSLLYQIDARSKLKGFVPQWAHFSTWINQRKWEEEIVCSDKSGGNSLSNIEDIISKKHEKAD